MSSSEDVACPLLVTARQRDKEQMSLFHRAQKDFACIYSVMKILVFRLLAIVTLNVIHFPLFCIYLLEIVMNIFLFQGHGWSRAIPHDNHLVL